MKAIGCFRQAVERDSGYAQAYAGLADAYVLLPFYGTHSPREVFPEARAAASRALELDGHLAEAHNSLAYTRFIYEGCWSQAEEGFRRAIELQTGYPTAHHWFGFLCAALGRHDAANELVRRALELDPLSLVINTDLGFVHYFARRYGDAVEQYRRTLELEPSFAYAHLGLCLAYERLGQLDEALAVARRGVGLAADSDSMLAIQGYVSAAAGRRSEALKVLAALRARSRRQRFQTILLAIVHYRTR